MYRVSPLADDRSKYKSDDRSVQLGPKMFIAAGNGNRFVAVAMVCCTLSAAAAAAATAAAVVLYCSSRRVQPFVTPPVFCLLFLLSLAL